VTAKKIKRRFKRFSLRFLWPLLPAGLLLVLAIFLSRSQFFTLQKITCQLDNHLCSLEFEPLLVNLHGQNIFKLNKSAIIKTFQQFDSTLSDIHLTKRLPNSLIISMKRRLPVAQISPTFGLEFQGLTSTQSASLSGQIKDQFFHLDKTGDIFLITDQPDPQLPSIMIPDNQPLDIGKSDLTQTLANLLNVLNAYYVSFDSLAWLKNTLIIIKTTVGSYAVLDSTKPLNSQVASLQYILSSIKIGENLPAKIDLRFDKPVLTY